MIKFFSIFFLLFLVFGCGNTTDKPVEEKADPAVEDTTAWQTLMNTAEFQAFKKAKEDYWKSEEDLKNTKEYQALKKAGQEFGLNTKEYQTYDKAYRNTKEYQAKEKAWQGYKKAWLALKDTEEWQEHKKAEKAYND